MRVLVVPDPVLTQVNRILFRDLWRKKDCNRKAFEKVKRTVVCSALENVGLNMIDLKQMQTAYLLQWVKSRLQAQALDKWSHIPKKEKRKKRKKKKSFCSLWRQILMFLFESEKSCFFRVAAGYLSLLELCFKNTARLELSLTTPLCLCQLCCGTTVILSIKEAYSCVWVGLLEIYCM